MVRDLRLRDAIGAADPGRLQRAAEEDADFEEAPLRPDEEVAGLAREHDRVVRRVDALLAELGGGLAQPLPGLAQILGEILRQRRLGRRPAVVRLALLDPLLAVVTLVAGHGCLKDARTQQRSDGKTYNPQADSSHQEPPEVMEVLLGNHDVFRTGESHPPWLEPAHDQPIEDEQVSEVEDEEHAERVAEELPEGTTSQRRRSPKQCRKKGNPMSKPNTTDIRRSVRLGRHDLSDLPWKMF